MWRVRHQSTVFQVFMQFCLHGLCSIFSLESPIGFESGARIRAAWIERALRCFESPLPLFARRSQHIDLASPDQLTGNPS